MVAASNTPPARHTQARLTHRGRDHDEPARGQRRARHAAERHRHVVAREPVVHRDHGRELPRVVGRTAAVTCHRAPDLAGDDARHALAFRPARQREHEQRDGQHQEGDARRELDDDEPALPHLSRPVPPRTGHGARSLGADPVTDTSQSGTSGSHEVSRARTVARMLPPTCPHRRTTVRAR